MSYYSWFMSATQDLENAPKQDQQEQGDCYPHMHSLQQQRDVIEELQSYQAEHHLYQASLEVYDHDWCDTIVTSHMRAMDSCRGLVTKIPVATRLMDFLVRHRQYTLDNLGETVRRKIEEFARDQNIRYEWHYWQLFRQQLPSYQPDRYRVIYNNVLTELQEYQEMEGLLMRSLTSYNKNEVCYTVKSYLAECQMALGKDNKKKACLKLMDYVVANKDFVHDHPKFSDTVRAKLIELATQEDFRLEWHYEKLFGEPLPVTESPSQAPDSEILRTSLSPPSKLPTNNPVPDLPEDPSSSSSSSYSDSSDESDYDYDSSYDSSYSSESSSYSSSSSESSSYSSSSSESSSYSSSSSSSYSSYDSEYDYDYSYEYSESSSSSSGSSDRSTSSQSDASSESSTSSSASYSYEYSYYSDDDSDSSTSSSASYSYEYSYYSDDDSDSSSNSNTSEVYAKALDLSLNAWIDKAMHRINATYDFGEETAKIIRELLKKSGHNPETFIKLFKEMCDENDQLSTVVSLAFQ